MAVGVVATLKVQDGKDKDFEAVFRDLAKAVRANEPGNKLYQVCKSRKDANTYVVMEIYESGATLHAFGAKLMPILMELGIEAKPTIFDVHNLMESAG